MGKQRKIWSTDVKEAMVVSVLRGELGVVEGSDVIRRFTCAFLIVWPVPPSPLRVQAQARLPESGRRPAGPRRLQQ